MKHERGRSRWLSLKFRLILNSEKTPTKALGTAAASWWRAWTQAMPDDCLAQPAQGSVGSLRTEYGRTAYEYKPGSGALHNSVWCLGANLQNRDFPGTCNRMLHVVQHLCRVPASRGTPLRLPCLRHALCSAEMCGTHFMRSFMATAAVQRVMSSTKPLPSSAAFTGCGSPLRSLCLLWKPFSCGFGPALDLHHPASFRYRLWHYEDRWHASKATSVAHATLIHLEGQTSVSDLAHRQARSRRASIRVIRPQLNCWLVTDMPCVCCSSLSSRRRGCRWSRGCF